LIVAPKQNHHSIGLPNLDVHADTRCRRLSADSPPPRTRACTVNSPAVANSIRRVADHRVEAAHRIANATTRCASHIGGRRRGDARCQAAWVSWKLGAHSRGRSNRDPTDAGLHMQCHGFGSPDLSKLDSNCGLPVVIEQRPCQDTATHRGGGRPHCGGTSGATTLKPLKDR
jgi:hypothetical protein